MEKEIVQMQLGLFFVNEYRGGFEEISIESRSTALSSQPLPVPPDAPAEIPRLILKFKDFEVNFAKNRLDLFFRDYNLSKDSVFDFVEKTISKFGIEIGRIGLVKNFFLDNNIEYLKGILAEDKIKGLDLKEINLRINSFKNINNLDCNNIEIISNGNIIKEVSGQKTQKEGIVIARDVNTMPDKTNKIKFDISKIKEFVDIFYTETDNFLIS